MTEYRVKALIACRGPSANRMRIHAKIMSVGITVFINPNHTFKREVCEQSHVFCTFSSLRKRSEHQKTSPPPTVGANAYTLHSDCKWIEIAYGDLSRLPSQNVMKILCSKMYEPHRS